MAILYPHVLLIEDDAIDAEGVRRAFKRYCVPNILTHVTDGAEALDVLRGEQGCVALPHPHLILLDLNMPRMGGIEFLQIIRQDSKLMQTIVFVLTTSDSQADISAAYDYNVAGYILKNKVGDGFSDVLSLLDHYQKIIQLPI